jgi:tRNA(Ile)-lysidine synthase
MKRNLEELFKHSLNDSEIEPGETIIVGVSGGSDSLALTLLLNNWCKTRNNRLIAVTIDHGLRKESQQESLYVAKLLEDLDIKHHILTWQGTKPSSNIMAHARNARYELLTNFCKTYQARYLFIAHNKEDVAETFMINLRRGSGLDGLAALKKYTQKNEVTIIRPLLNISRFTLREYLEGQKITWIDDPSNENEKFERIKIRKLLGEDDLLIDRINLAGSHLRLVKNFVDKKIFESLLDVTKCYEFGVVQLDLQKFLDLGEYEIITILAKILQLVSGSYQKPRYQNLLSLIPRIKMENFKAATLMNCKIMLHKKNFLLIYREDKNTQKIDIQQQSQMLWDKRVNINLPKSFLGKDYHIETMSARGWQTLDKSKITIDKVLINMPKSVFYSFPVIKHLERIVYIPYLDYEQESYTSQKPQFVFSLLHDLK